MSPVRYSTVYAAKDFARLEADLRDVPEHMRKALDRRLRPAGEKTVSAIRRHASWSSRIPGAVRLRVAFKAKDVGLIITVDHNAAPHARPFEGIVARAGHGNTFRHPVFGDTDTWVDQPFRRFVWPGVEETQQEVADAVDEAVAAAFHAAGWD